MEPRKPIDPPADITSLPASSLQSAASEDTAAGSQPHQVQGHVPVQLVQVLAFLSMELHEARHTY